MAGTIRLGPINVRTLDSVSMESGLDGRNNIPRNLPRAQNPLVSMESGLDGRNNSIY